MGIFSSLFLSMFTTAILILLFGKSIPEVTVFGILILFVAFLFVIMKRVPTLENKQEVVIRSLITTSFGWYVHDRLLATGKSIYTMEELGLSPGEVDIYFPMVFMSIVFVLHLFMPPGRY